MAENTHNTSRGSPVLEQDYPFAQLGIREPIARALVDAFPDVRTPTPTQAKFIPAILAGKDVLLKDATGTGKSFGVLLAVLNKPRVQKCDRARVDAGAKPPINTLIIVPHRDLAYQLYHWTQRLSSALPRALTSISSLAHLCVRNASDPPLVQCTRLREDPPHILIGTPTGLQDILQTDPDALQLHTLSTIVADESDALIPSIPNVRKTKREQLERKHARHPAPTVTLLDTVFAARQQQDEQQKGQRASRPPLQLILSSATLRNHFKRSIIRHPGWLERSSGETAWVNGTGAATTPGAGNVSGVLHSLLLVSRDGTARNVEGSVDPPLEEMREEEEGFAPLEEEDVTDKPGPPESTEPSTSRKPQPFSPAVLETVAATFALDVPRAALLVLPAGSNVRTAVDDLCGLGVHAQGLDLRTEEHGTRAHLLQPGSNTALARPTLLVATLSTTRGIDLPALSHVFVLDVDAERLVDTYVHVAGRVGRFGRTGRVVCVVDDEGAEAELRRRRFSLIFRELGIQPTRMEHFE